MNRDVLHQRHQAAWRTTPRNPCQLPTREMADHLFRQLLSSAFPRTFRAGNGWVTVTRTENAFLLCPEGGANVLFQLEYRRSPNGPAAQASTEVVIRRLRLLQRRLPIPRWVGVSFQDVFSDRIGVGHPSPYPVQEVQEALHDFVAQLDGMTIPIALSPIPQAGLPGDWLSPWSK